MPRSRTRPALRYPLRTRPCAAAAANIPHRIYEREKLRPGDRIVGTAIIAEANATTMIELGWQLPSRRKTVLHWRLKRLAVVDTEPPGPRRRSR
ncbi:MAG: hypothetical protein ACREX4_19310 [Gammaproteobacteria bacterium]